MKIQLYSLLTCSRCKVAKMMLDKRNLKYEVLHPSAEMHDELPILIVDGERYSAKAALLQIRKLKGEQNG